MKCFERSYGNNKVDIGIENPGIDGSGCNPHDEKTLLEDELQRTRERSRVLLQMIMWEQQHSFWRYW
jgi:hypothetical protein